MPALVPQLVNMASDPAVSTADLLRRALVAARRLELPDLATWIKLELNGYFGCNDENLPDYRILKGQLLVMNPVNGLIPYVIHNQEMLSLITKHSEGQSIPELESIARSNGELGRYLPPAAEQFLMSRMSFPMRPQLSFSTAQISGIVEKVRNRVLEWALDLEYQGILGEGMTFTPTEKQMVQEIHNYFGNVSGSQIQIASHRSSQTQTDTTTTDLDALNGLIEGLSSILERGSISGTTADELRAEVATLKAQAASPKPKWEIIKATARSIKVATEGAASTILSELAKPHIATLFALATS